MVALNGRRVQPVHLRVPLTEAERAEERALLPECRQLMPWVQ